ncbi:MAG: Nif3-like dinuclear metal center hexameric protein, partial [Gammaproteobacteria bacterium]|nr:Nif3-like dinuclear metal center hexameric protein [Gammaproteobacteria bacterium]
MPELKHILEYANNVLSVDQYNDYGPNGLQVEGRREIKSILAGVSASQALIDEAVRINADMLLVHHGYFWR